MTWPVHLSLNKNLFYCVWSQEWWRKNLHHAGGGHYWFSPQYIRKLIYWPALNASAQTNSQTSITNHHKSILTDCGGPCMSAQLKTRSRGPTLHLQGRELRRGGGWWAWHCAAHCTHMLICPQTSSDSRTWGRRKPSMHSNERLFWKDRGESPAHICRRDDALPGAGCNPNQNNDYLPSPQALTQFWFMIRMTIDFPDTPPSPPSPSSHFSF